MNSWWATLLLIGTIIAGLREIFNLHARRSAERKIAELKQAAIDAEIMNNREISKKAKDEYEKARDDFRRKYGIINNPSSKS